MKVYHLLFVMLLCVTISFHFPVAMAETGESDSFHILPHFLGTSQTHLLVHGFRKLLRDALCSLCVDR